MYNTNNITGIDYRYMKLFDALTVQVKSTFWSEAAVVKPCTNFVTRAGVSFPWQTGYECGLPLLTVPNHKHPHGRVDTVATYMYMKCTKN